MKRGRRNTGLLRLALLVVAGRRFWLLPFLPLLWLLFQAGVLIIGAEEGFTPASAQVALVGLPLTLLAVFLGLRIIAGEIDGRSLEIAYTVPGGCERVWWAKLLASTLVLLASETLLVAGTYIFFTPMPWSALYGALQPALFYLVLAMGMATLFRSEVAGAMGVAAILGLDLLISGFGTNPVRISPFWNPAVAIDQADDAAQFLAWNLQNRIGILLAMAAILGLAFMRANRRERMLGA
jgi:ABC-type transport system involved in multi-copper enzyme maturation permease subunit